MIPCIIMTAIGFLSGSVMYSYIIPKVLKNIDVREYFSDQNPGGMNALNVVGVPLGLVCISLDVLKAFIPVFIASGLLNISGGYLIPVTAAPVVGHAFTPFLNFKGGKALASAFGSLMGIVIISKVILIVFITFAFFKFIINIQPDSTKVIVSFIVSCILFFLFEPDSAVKTAAIIISLIVCFKHFINPNKGENKIIIGPITVTIIDKKLKFTKA